MKRLYVLCLLLSCAVRADSMLVTDGFVSNFVPKSPNNTVNDERLFTAYLPDGALESGELYPVIYYCPGLGGTNQSFTLGNQIILDDLISNNLMVPTIVIHIDPSLVTGVDQDGRRKYQGSWYVNSDLNGAFEDYIVQELIPYVDAHYPTKATAPFRAIMGQSMGGHGALYLGTTHPELFTGFGSASGTPFWSFISDLASPGCAEFTMNSLILPEVPTAGVDAGKVLPTNGVGSFSVFSYAGAFSPNLSGDTPFAAEFFVDMPFYMNPDGTPSLIDRMVEVVNLATLQRTEQDKSLLLRPEIVDKWQMFDVYLLADVYKDTLKKQAIYLDAGSTEPLNNVGARLLSDKYADCGIDHEYILYNGGHVACLDLPLCSRHRTMFQLFSAKFAEAGSPVDDIRVKIVGTGSIAIEDGVFDIAEGTLVGVETLLDGSVTTTDVQFELKDNGVLTIGQDMVPGGALQIGNRYSKARLDGDPSLANHSICCTLCVNGDNAVFRLGKQGFLGLGAGTDGKVPTQPNYWGMSCLNNVADVAIEIQKGSFDAAQCASGQESHASLFVIGQSEHYSFMIDEDSAVMRGGSNQVGTSDCWRMHPMLKDEANVLLPGGIRNNLNTNPSAIDQIYLQPIGSTRFYTNTITREILSSSEQLDDRVTDDAFVIETDVAQSYCDFLDANEYLAEASKEGALAVGADGGPCVVYLDRKTADATVCSIIRVPSGQIPVGVSGSLDFEKIRAESATVGVWVENVDGQRQLLLVYDLNPQV